MQICICTEVTSRHSRSHSLPVVHHSLQLLKQEISATGQHMSGADPQEMTLLICASRCMHETGGHDQRVNPCLWITGLQLKASTVLVTSSQQCGLG